MEFTFLKFETIDSTNTYAAEQARRGAPEGLVVSAAEQTAGRGRLGRKFVSRKGAGLYVSFLLRPRLDVKYLPLITLAAGVAVHETLAKLSISSDIKWVNDILIDDRKTAGILTEAVETVKGTAIILGIGINVTPLAVPSELADSATSLEAAAGRKISINDELLPLLATSVRRFYDVLRSDGGAEMIRDEWSSRSSFASGKNVRVVLENETLTGVTDGLETSGALRLATADGPRIIQAGDVQQVRQKK